MKRVCIALTLLVGAGVLELGCGNPCDNARARFTNRYDECGIPPVEPGDSAVSEGAQCTDSDGKYLDCLADCAESAKCEALNGEDPLAGADFGDCTADCQ